MHTKAGIIGLGLLFIAHGAFALPNQDDIHIIIKYKQQIKIRLH